MELTDTIKLSKAAAAAMSLSGSPRKEGESVSVSYLLQWGGAGAYREWADILAIKATVAAQSTQLKALTAAVTALAANSPAAIQAAFREGQEALAKQLQEMKLNVTFDDNDPSTP